MRTERESGYPRTTRSGPGRGRGAGRWAQQGPFACPECGKAFERKEYRDKHHRRCLKAATEPRQTRQRSCIACVASKLGCDQKQPTCSRCVLRGKRCEYATERTAGLLQPQSPEAELEPEPEPQPFSPVLVDYSTFDKIDSVYPRLTPDPDEGMAVRPLVTEMNPASLVAGGTGTQTQVHGNTYQPWALDPQLNGTQQAHAPDRVMKDANANLMSDWLRRSPSHGFVATNDAEAATQWAPRGWPSRSPSVTMGEATTIQPEWDDTLQLNVNGDVHFDLLGSLGVLPRTRVTPGVQQVPGMMQPLPVVAGGSVVNSSNTRRDVAVNNTGQGSSSNSSSEIPINPPTNKERSPPTFRDVIPNKTRESRALVPTAALEDDSPIVPSLLPKFQSDHDTVQVICSYPRLMLRPGIYPPFVHHKIYPCAEGEILEPLAKAFCCVGAFYASVRTSESFVNALMNNESRRLVNGFQLWSNSDSSMLAAVHAMCIYQILGFFSSTNPEQTRLAELQQLFFLKMVRKLIAAHLRLGSGDESEQLSWRKWIMNETIRRTVFLANIINILSYRTQKQNPFYYEALNDEVVMNMVLPAPPAVWKASSEEEWLAARGKLGLDEQARSRMTVQMALNQFDGQQSGTTTAGRGKGRSRGNDQVQFENLDEFTRLVIATARIHR